MFSDIFLSKPVIPIERQQVLLHSFLMTFHTVYFHPTFFMYLSISFLVQLVDFKIRRSNKS